MKGGGARFNFPHPPVVGVGFALAAIIAAGGLLFGSWLHLRALARDAALLDEQLRHHRVVFDEVRQAMASWRELQAKIWEPFGPGLAPGGCDQGIGGATKTDPERPGLSPSDELNRVSQAVREQTESLRALEQLMTRAGRALAALPSRWPVRGAVNSEFGYRHSPWSNERGFHAGIDIRAARGTPVYAPAPGTVIQAGQAQDYGTTIIVNHGQDVRTLYGHLSKLNVQSGQRVEHGRSSATPANPGRSSGPHRSLRDPGPWSGRQSARVPLGLIAMEAPGASKPTSCGRSGSRSPAARWCVNRATWTRSSPAPSGWAGGRRGPGT